MSKISGWVCYSGGTAFHEVEGRKKVNDGMRGCLSTAIFLVNTESTSGPIMLLRG